MTTLLFEIGLHKPSRLAMPPGSSAEPTPEWVKLAEQRMELDAERLADLARGYIEIAFPIAALQGKATPRDELAVRIALPNHNLVEPEEEQ